jgi:hypothetical protein
MTKGISDELQSAFTTIGAVDNRIYLSEIKIGETDYPLSDSFLAIFSNLRSIIGPVFLFDYFSLEDPADYFEIHFSHRQNTIVPIDLSEYPCTKDAPYVGICKNQQDSYFAIRLDDPDPSDPKVYFIDHDDWDGTPPRDKDYKLSDFLDSLMRKEG